MHIEVVMDTLHTDSLLAISHLLAATGICS